MALNLQELKGLVSEGESEHVEFKRSTGQRTDAARTVCGMLNGQGGIVLFGADDKGVLLGQRISSRTLEDIANEMRRIEPPAFPDIETVMLHDRIGVVGLRVPALGGSYTYDGRAYLRQGPTTRIMPREEFERRLIDRLHSTRRWENEPVPDGVGIADLDTEEIETTLANAINAGRMDRPRKMGVRAILVGLGLIVDGRLLNAAVALYGESKRLESIYPQFALRMARYRGAGRLADYADNRQYWGSAFALLRRAESFLLDHVPIASRVISGKMERLDRPLYPPRATREALANAFCHRDYSTPGGAVAVAMYDGRLEIANPGGLHFGMTPEKLTRPHESKPWNPIIANVFYRAGIIERWGSGTLNIIDWCKENDNPRPSWAERAGSVVLTFKPNAAATRAAELESRPKSQLESRLQSQLESLREKVLSLLSSGPLSKSGLAAKLGQKQPSGQLHKVIRELLEEGTIAYTIPGRPQSRLQKYVLAQRIDEGESG